MRGKLHEELVDHVRNDRCLFVVGTGVSLSATNSAEVAGWTGLIRSGLEYCAEVGGRRAWVKRKLKALEDAAKSESPDDLIEIASVVERTLGGVKRRKGNYRQWLRDTFETLQATEEGLPRILQALGRGRLATCNYDDILTAPDMPPVTWTDSAGFGDVLSRNGRGVLHLHGHWRNPESVILGFGSYAVHGANKAIQELQQAASRFLSLIFVGFGAGLEDPNLGSLWKWMAANISERGAHHFTLVTEGQVERFHKRFDRDARLAPLSYGATHGQLLPYLTELAARAGIQVKPASSRVRDADRASWMHDETDRYASEEVKDRLISSGSTSRFAIDDSVRLLALDLDGGTEIPGGDLPVVYRPVPGLTIDPANKTPTREQLALSVEGFDPAVASYLRAQLEQPGDAISQWKLGLASVTNPIEMLDQYHPTIALRPLAYRVSELFNRNLVSRRVAGLLGGKDLYPELGRLYERSASNILSQPDASSFPCPSQLFVELALLTSDGCCLLVRKKYGAEAGVVAQLGRTWTCGPEFGLTFAHLREEKAIRLGDGIETAVRREFGVSRDQIRRWHIAGMALQMVHLNTAFYGYCELTIPGSQLVEAFLANGSKQFESSGVRDRPYPELVSLQSLRSVLDDEAVRHDGSLWHPTARIRLHSLLAKPAAGS